MNTFKHPATLVGVMLITLLSAPAWTHHSFAMFEMDKIVKLEGSVKQFQWTNPHVFIQLAVIDAATGQEVEWSIEADSPNVLTRRGWTRKSLKAGDRVVLEMHPLKKGVFGGALATASVNGQLIGNPGYTQPNAVQGQPEGAQR